MPDVFKLAVMFPEPVTGDPETEKSEDVMPTEVTVPEPPVGTLRTPVELLYVAAPLPVVVNDIADLLRAFVKYKLVPSNKSVVDLPENAVLKRDAV